MKRALPFVIAALMIPGVALAKGKPPIAGTHMNHGKANVQYILKGTLSAFTAFDSTTNTNGSITIMVTHSNRHGRVLKGQTLTFPMVTANTKVVLHNGATVITNGDRGIVKVRAPKEPKDISATDLTTVLTGMPVRQIIDQGSSS
jgi:hypothetical protein